MHAQVRDGLILDALVTEQRVEIGDLTALLGVSEMTVRRDLARLEATGAVRRVHGGATRAQSGSYEPPFALRARRRQEAKRAIARAVVAGIEDGQTVVLDAGTSGLAVAEFLAGRVATVCPLSLRAAGVLVGSPTIRLLMPGGFVRPDEQSFVGAEATRTLDEHVFDTYVMTVSGLSIAGGLTEWNADDVIVKRSALANCRRCVVACDSSKLGQTAFTRIAALEEVDLVVTDDGLDDRMRGLLEESGTELLVVATPGGRLPRPGAGGDPASRAPRVEPRRRAR